MHCGKCNGPISPLIRLHSGLHALARQSPLVHARTRHEPHLSRPDHCRNLPVKWRSSAKKKWKYSSVGADKMKDLDAQVDRQFQTFQTNGYVRQRICGGARIVLAKFDVLASQTIRHWTIIGPCTTGATVVQRAIDSGHCFTFLFQIEQGRSRQAIEIKSPFFSTMRCNCRTMRCISRH